MALVDTIAVRGENAATQKSRRHWIGARRIVEPLILPLLVLALWQAASIFHWASVQILPPPTDVFQTFLQLWGDGEIQTHVSVSLMRVIQGFAIGATIGILLGLLMGQFRVIDDMVHPFFRAYCKYRHLRGCRC